MATIYKIENPIGEVYIGSTNRDEISTRKAEHKYSWKKGRESKLYDSFTTHGFDSHSFYVIGNAPTDDIRELEHFVIEELNPSLNIVKQYNATHTGQVWITNGVEERFVFKDAQLPDGFKLGRKPNDKLGRRKINK